MLALAEQVSPEAGFCRRAFMFYTGEEGPAEANALRNILKCEPWLRRADLAILLEPTHGDLELGCNGSIHIGVTFRGKACHSARPWLGLHPLQAALPWFDRILRHPIREVEISGAVFREVVTLTTVHAGEARNVIPGTLAVNLNLRYAPDRSYEEAERLAWSLCPEGTVRGQGGSNGPAGNPEGSEAAGESKESPVEAVLLDHSPAGRIDLEAPLYRHLCQSTGLPRRAKQGWTDVARFTACGVPALNWGPGDPELAHTREEWVGIEEAERCFGSMKAFFLGEGPKA
jgi:succinyl-diaminopimelate desuccinylase